MGVLEKRLLESFLRRPHLVELKKDQVCEWVLECGYSKTVSAGRIVE